MGHGVVSSTICLNKAKFHYTGPTGPARIFFAARVSEKLRWVRAGHRLSPCGSGRARVVEFSLYWGSCRRRSVCIMRTQTHRQTDRHTHTQMQMQRLRVGGTVTRINNGPSVRRRYWHNRLPYRTRALRDVRLSGEFYSQTAKTSETDTTSVFAAAILPGLSVDRWQD